MGVVDAPEVIVAASREEAVSAFGDGADVTVVARRDDRDARDHARPPAAAPGAADRPRRPVGRAQRERPHDDRRDDDDRRARGRRRAAGHLRARPRRPRDPRAGHARRQPVRAAGRRDARAATCRPRCSRSTRRCARPAPAASAPSRSRTSSPPAPPGRLVLDVAFADPEAGASASVRRPHAHAYTIMRVCAARVGGELRVAVSGAGPTRRAQPRGRGRGGRRRRRRDRRRARARRRHPPRRCPRVELVPRPDAARARPPRPRRPALKENDETHGQRHRARRGLAPAHDAAARPARGALRHEPEGGLPAGRLRRLHGARRRRAAARVPDCRSPRSRARRSRRSRASASPTSSPPCRPPSTSTTPRSAASAPRAS